MMDIEEEIDTLENKLSIPRPSPSGDIASSENKESLG
jgi:hypothetical protein